MLVNRSVVDLSSETRRIQAESDSLYGSAAVNPDAPAWRLFARGPLAGLVPGRVVDAPLYLAAWLADDPADGHATRLRPQWPRPCSRHRVRGRGQAIRGSDRRTCQAHRVRRPAVGHTDCFVEGATLTSEAVRCPSCQVLVHARHSRCPKCRAHLVVKSTSPLGSPYLKFAALGVVLAFAGLVGGLWVTRAEPIANGVAGPDPLKSRRAAPPLASTGIPVIGPIETRALLEPEGQRDSGENALAAQAVASATLRDDPDNVVALGNMGMALLRLHDPSKALPLFEHAARVAPDQWQLQFNLARAQAQLGRWKDAATSLQAAKSLKPDDYATAVNLAISLHRSGDDERAIDEYRRAIGHQFTRRVAPAGPGHQSAADEADSRRHSRVSGVPRDLYRTRRMRSRSPRG